VDRLLQQLEDLGWQPLWHGKSIVKTGPKRGKTRENHRKTSGVHEKSMESLEESD